MYSYSGYGGQIQQPAMQPSYSRQSAVSTGRIDGQQDGAGKYAKRERRSLSLCSISSTSGGITAAKLPEKSSAFPSQHTAEGDSTIKRQQQHLCARTKSADLYQQKSTTNVILTPMGAIHPQPVGLSHRI